MGFIQEDAHLKTPLNPIQPRLHVFTPPPHHHPPLSIAILLPSSLCPCLPACAEILPLLLVSSSPSIPIITHANNNKVGKRL